MGSMNNPVATRFLREGAISRTRRLVVITFRQAIVSPRARVMGYVAMSIIRNVSATMATTTGGTHVVSIPIGEKAASINAMAVGSIGILSSTATTTGVPRTSVTIQ